MIGRNITKQLQRKIFKGISRRNFLGKKDLAIKKDSLWQFQEIESPLEREDNPSGQKGLKTYVDWDTDEKRGSLGEF